MSSGQQWTDYYAACQPALTDDDGCNLLLLIDSTLIALDLTGASQRRAINFGLIDLSMSTTVNGSIKIAQRS